MKFLGSILLLFAVGCLKENQTPEASLKEFINGRVGQIVDRSFIESRVTGKMLATFKTMSDQEFKSFADLKNIKKESIKITGKSCLDQRCLITYSLAYQTLQDGKAQFNSQVEKVAELVRIENQWLISSVNNVVTSHEGLEPINPFQ